MAPRFMKINFAQGKIVEARLHEHCREQDGFAVYDDGWNDNRVAETLQAELPGITANHVANIRTLTLGRQRAPAAPKQPDQLKALGEYYDKVLETLKKWSAHQEGRIQQWAQQTNETVTKAIAGAVAKVAHRIAELEARSVVQGNHLSKALNELEDLRDDHKRLQARFEALVATWGEKV